MPNQRSRVFISYALEDKERVIKLNQWLIEAGFQTWFDKESLVGGERWERSVKEALKSSDVILVCLSKNSLNKKGTIHKELSMALETAQEMPDGEILIIPVQLDDILLPESLIGKQYIDLSRSNDLAETLFKKSLRMMAESRLAGDSTTDAPPPDVKKKKRKGK